MTMLRALTLESEMRVEIAKFVASAPDRRISHNFNIVWDDYMDHWYIRTGGCACPIGIFVMQRNIKMDIDNSVITPSDAMRHYIRTDRDIVAHAIWAGFDDGIKMVFDDPMMTPAEISPYYEMGKRLHDFVKIQYPDRHDCLEGTLED